MQLPTQKGWAGDKGIGTGLGSSAYKQKGYVPGSGLHNGISKDTNVSKKTAVSNNSFNKYSPKKAEKQPQGNQAATSNNP